MDTSIKINKFQASMLEMIVYPIIHTPMEIEDDSILLYFTIQSVLSNLSEKLSRLKFNGTKAKKIELGRPAFFALMFAISSFQTEDPWINANLIELADKMHRQYINTINVPTYIGQVY